MDHFSPSYFALLGPLDRARLAEQIIPEYIARVLKVLSEADIRYLLGGDLALTLHGAPGRSHELVLLIDPEGNNIRRFIQAIESEQLDSCNDAAFKQLRRGERTLKLTLLKAPEMGLDAIFKASLPFEKLYDRRVSLTLDSFIVSLVSLEDLTFMKSGTDELTGRADE